MEIRRASMFLGLTLGMTFLAGSGVDAGVPVNKAPPNNSTISPPQDEVIANCPEKGPSHTSTILFTKRGVLTEGHFEVELSPLALAPKKTSYALETKDQNCPQLNLVILRNPDDTLKVVGRIRAGKGLLQWESQYPKRDLAQGGIFIFRTDQRWDNIYPEGPNETVVTTFLAKPQFP